jgi:sec-independent protein translocase protein TatA
VVAFIEGPELLIVLIVVLLVFGADRLPKLARSLGQAQHEFKKGMAEDGQDAPGRVRPVVADRGPRVTSITEAKEIRDRFVSL